MVRWAGFSGIHHTPQVLMELMQEDEKAAGPMDW